MRDYYKILGLKESASEEEIRLRWIELMKRYHPDRGGGGEVDDTVKEINEAYETLKYSSTRLRYDLKRSYERRKRRVYLRKRIIRFSPLAVPLALAILLFFGIRSRSPEAPSLTKPQAAEDEVVRKSPSPAVPKTDQKSVPPTTPHRMKHPVEVDRVVAPVPASPRSQPEPVLPPSAPKQPQLQPQPQFQAQPQSQPVISSSPPLLSTSSSQPQAQSQPQPQPRPVVTSSPAPAATPGPQPQQQPQPVVISSPAPAGTPGPQPKAQPVIPSSPSPVRSPVLPQPQPVITSSPAPAATSSSQPQAQSHPQPQPQPDISSFPIKEGEVKQFLSRYADRYTERDFDGFVSFFSPGAIQNEKDGIDGIRKTYSQLFDQSRKLTYQLKDLHIDLLKDSARVRASYEIDQVLKAGGEYFWKGKVEWVLVKEDGDLKVLRLLYSEGDHPRVLAPVSPPQVQPQPQPGVTSSSSPAPGSRLLSEEEVMDFLSRYIERYNRLDIEGFLSFFSRKVIQNGKDGIEKVRKTYTRFFRESEKVIYQISDTRIDLLKETARVRASYEIEQLLKKKGVVHKWRGIAEWTLIREGGELKIADLRYRHDQLQ